GDAWVSVEKPHDIPVSNLVGLWAFYNLHLAHIISNIPKDKYSVLFHADAEEPKTLEWLVQDYIRHLVHHLKQILP
ncbi:MAG: DinB family protein, partial [Bacteroidota bacterium]